MNFDDYSKPMLTEPGIKYFLNETLKQCHQIRIAHYNTFYNLGLVAAFLLVLGAILLYKYKGKLSQEEIEERDVQKKHYIMSKIRNYQDAKLRAQQQLITGLPHWQDELGSV
jgi:hypothetical protein